MKKFIILLCLFLVACQPLYAQYAPWNVEWLQLNTDEYTTNYNIYVGYSDDSVNVFIDSAAFSSIQNVIVGYTFDHDSLFAVFGDGLVTVQVPFLENGQYAQVALVAINNRVDDPYYRYSRISTSNISKTPVILAPNKPANLPGNRVTIRKPQ